MTSKTVPAAVFFACMLAAPAEAGNTGRGFCHGVRGAWTGSMWHGYARGSRSDTPFNGTIFSRGAACRARFRVTLSNGWVVQEFAVTFPGQTIHLRGTEISSRSGNSRYNLDTLTGTLNPGRDALAGSWVDSQYARGHFAFFRVIPRPQKNPCAGVAGAWHGVMRGPNMKDHRFKGKIAPSRGRCMGRFTVDFVTNRVHEEFLVTVSGDRVEMNGFSVDSTGYNLDNITGRLNAGRTAFSGSWSSARGAKGTTSFSRK